MYGFSDHHFSEKDILDIKNKSLKRSIEKGLYAIT
jgi:hypothetical protein